MAAPLYGPPNVQRQAAPNARLSPEADAGSMGAGLFAGIDQGAAAFGDVAERARSQADAARLLGVQAQVTQKVTDLLHDPKTGALNQHGEQAFALPDQVLGSFDSFASDITGGLSNDRQRLAAARIIEQNRSDLQRSVLTHVGNEQTSYATEQKNAVVGLAQANAATVVNAPDAGDQIAASIEKQRQAIDIHAHATGQPADMTALEKQEATSATHLSVLQTLSSTGQDIQAKAWYDAHKGDLTAHDGITAAKLVEAGSTAGESQRIADTIVLTKDGAVDTRAAIDERVRSDPRLAADAKLRDAVQSRVDQRLQQEKQATEEADRAGFTQAWKLATDPTNPQGVNSPQVQAIAANLSPERQQQLATYAKRDIPTFSQDVYDLRRLVGTPAFEHVDLTQYVGRVRGDTLDEMAKLQQEQRDKGLNAPKVHDVVTDAKIVDNALHNLALDQDGQQRSDTALDYEQKYSAAVAQAVAANGGKPVSDTERRAIATTLSKDYVTQVQRAAHSPLRLFSATASNDAGPIYKQPGDVIGRQLPIHGTVSETTGEGLSADDLQQWVAAVNAPDAQGRTATTAQLARMANGIASDGSYDPALIQRYQLIKAAARAAKAPQTPAKAVP